MTDFIQISLDLIEKCKSIDVETGNANATINKMINDGNRHERLVNDLTQIYNAAIATTKKEAIANKKLQQINASEVPMIGIDAFVKTMTDLKRKEAEFGYLYNLFVWIGIWWQCQQNIEECGMSTRDHSGEFQANVDRCVKFITEYRELIPFTLFDVCFVFVYIFDLAGFSMVLILYLNY